MPTRPLLIQIGLQYPHDMSLPDLLARLRLAAEFGLTEALCNKILVVCQKGVEAAITTEVVTSVTTTTTVSGAL